MIQLLLCLFLDIQQPPVLPLPQWPNLETPKNDNRIIYLDARIKITSKTAIYFGEKRISFDAFFKLDVEELYVRELLVKNGEVVKIIFEVDE